MREKLRRAAELFWAFFKIGAFTFGGGYAMIPLIERETVEKKKWIASEDILNIVAIAESTPGPIAVNAATFIGYKTAGFLGAACATFGVVLPSFVIISLVSRLLARFSTLAPVRYAFFGVRAAVLALLLKALWSMVKKCPKNWFSYAIAAAAFVAVALFRLPVLAVIVGCALVGLLSAWLRRGRGKT